jgi:NTE family protein
VVCGRGAAPDADLADAVAASCAIPGFYHPVEIDGRRYVDGGMYSNSNLDVLRDEELDLVVCLNPTSTLHPPRAADPLEWVANGVRGASGRRLGREARRLRDQGTDVVLIQPTAEDIALMGWNLMARRDRHKVVETAVKTVREQLQDPDVRASLEGLPQGAPEMVRRPPGPPSTWPVIGTRGVARSAVGSRGQSAAEEAAG